MKVAKPSTISLRFLRLCLRAKDGVNMRVSKYSSYKRMKTVMEMAPLPASELSFKKLYTSKP